jgi:signal transduction histidine kinase
MSDLQQNIHDIRKPLNTISMQAELIKMLVEASDKSPKLIEAASKIILNSKQCSDLLQNLFEEIESPAEPLSSASKDIK